jgi:hypothetical protein
MTVDEFMDRAMPTIGPLSGGQRFLAFRHVADVLRGRDDVSEALADQLLAELRARFERPLS